MEVILMEDVLLAWIRKARSHQFLLIIAGRLSGFHGWKRTHIPVAFQVNGSTVMIHFDGAELLTIYGSEDVIMKPGGELLVGDASEVRFTWCSDKDPTKDCEEIFTKVSSLIMFHRSDDLYATGTGFMSFEENFVVLRSIQSAFSPLRFT